MYLENLLTTHSDVCLFSKFSRLERYLFYTYGIQYITYFFRKHESPEHKNCCHIQLEHNCNVNKFMLS